jgi:hypothetical protein
MVAAKLTVAGNNTVDTVKYLPCLYTTAEVLLFGTPAFLLGVGVGFMLGYHFGF